MTGEELRCFGVEMFERARLVCIQLLILYTDVYCTFLMLPIRVLEQYRIVPVVVNSLAY